VNNRVLGNLIGTDHSTAMPLSNGSAIGVQHQDPGFRRRQRDRRSSIRIQDSDANTIGGHDPGAGNVIATNTGNGLEIGPGTANLVLGNAIGTNMSGDPWTRQRPQRHPDLRR
jgi:hypothetical protein